MSGFKKFMIFLAVILVLAGSAAGGVYAYQQYQSENKTVQVTPVASLNWGWQGDSMTTSGTVLDSYSQSVYLEDKTVAEVKVEEGQTVKTGDPLLVYDTSETQIQIEMKKLELQGIKNDITLAEREIARLKSMTPAAPAAQQTAASNQTAQSAAKPSSTSSTVKQTTVIQMQVQRKDGDAYNYIDSKAKPYEGEGTADNPYRFLCTGQCYVLGDYLNQLIKNEESAAFEIWRGNSTAEGTLLTCWTFIGTERDLVDADSKWLVSTQQKIENTVEIEEPESESETETETESESESESGTDSTERSYTAEELKKEIAEKESELEELQINRKSVRLELKSLRKTKKSATLLSKIDGVVRTVGDPENPPSDGSAFMEIAGAEGMYLRGEISELLYDQIEVGQEISANSWNTGQDYIAKITEISEYPSTTGGGYRGDGNSNVSYYSFMAYIENPEGLSNDDYLDISITPVVNEEEQRDSLYIDKAYVREENGKYYVLKAGKDSRLVKQYVQTGKTLYGSAIEVKSGLEESDSIAFPYGKEAKEGVKTEESNGMY